jgi:hypothetical protein
VFDMVKGSRVPCGEMWRGGSSIHRTSLMKNYARGMPPPRHANLVELSSPSKPGPTAILRRPWPVAAWRPDPRLPPLPALPASPDQSKPRAHRMS